MAVKVKVSSELASIVEAIEKHRALTKTSTETVTLAETKVAPTAGDLIKVVNETETIVESKAKQSGGTLIKFVNATVTINESVSAGPNQVAVAGDVETVDESIAVVTALAAGPYEEMHCAVRSHAYEQVELGLGISTLYPNQASSAPFGNVWAEVEIRDAETELIAIGRQKTYRKRGELVVVLRSSLNRGDQAIQAQASLIDTAFRQQFVSAIRYGNPWVEYQGQDFQRGRAHWRSDVHVPFYSDDVHASDAPYGTWTYPTLEEVHNAVRARLDREAALGGAPVIYDNDPTKPPTRGTWVRWAVQTGRPSDATGKGGVITTPGLATALIFVQAGTGTEAALALADSIVLRFRHVKDSGVAFGTPYLVTVGRSGAWWQTNAVCPFQFQGVNP